MTGVQTCALPIWTTTSLLNVADLSTVWINADVFEGNVPLLGSLEQQTVTIVNEAWPDKTFQAKVFFTGEIMDEKTRTIALRAIAENTERLLKPGMFVNVIIPGAKGKSLMVPTQAVQEHDGKKFVFIHKEGSAFERRDIVTGPNTSQGVVVRSGITPEDSVVINGAFILKTRMLAELLGEE